MKRPGKHRFSLDLPIGFYEEIKQMAEARNVTITGWITLAVLEKIIKERQRD
jgi:hypothetical protein